RPSRLRSIFRSLGKPANLAGGIVCPHRNSVAHGKPPQFAILNHAAVDSGIPRESATQRIGISGRRGNFCREAPDGLSLAQTSPCRARMSGKPPAARRNGWLVARADRKSSLLPLASGRTFLNRVRDPFISDPSTKTP